MGTNEPRGGAPRRRTLVVAAGLLLIVVPGVAAGAQDLEAAQVPPEFVSSAPENGDSIYSVPDEIEATFSEPLDDASSLSVWDPCQRQIDDRASEVTGSTIRVGLAEKPKGLYTVRYDARSIANTTGSTVGTFHFTVHGGESCDGSGHGHAGSPTKPERHEPTHGAGGPRTERSGDGSAVAHRPEHRPRHRTPTPSGRAPHAFHDGHRETPGRAPHGSPSEHDASPSEHDASHHGVLGPAAAASSPAAVPATTPVPELASEAAAILALLAVAIVGALGGVTLRVIENQMDKQWDRAREAYEPTQKQDQASPRLNAVPES